MTAVGAFVMGMATTPRPPRRPRWQRLIDSLLLGIATFIVVCIVIMATAAA
jgi:hypothetical protein